MPSWYSQLPWDNINRVATHAGILPQLLGAFVMTESSGNTNATRFEEHYKYLSDVNAHASRLGISPEVETKNQKTSWGLLQIMGGTARDLGFRDNLEKLCEPETGLLWGCILISRLLHKYSTLEDAIAAYNGGSPRKDAKGNLEPRLQCYVDKVMGYYGELKHENRTVRPVA